MSRSPVEDWTTDFDHTDPRWTADPYTLWSELRRTCPIAHTDRFQDGVWLPTRYADVRAIAYDTETFSSRRVVIRDRKIEPPHPAPPITSDPPDHKRLRLPLLPPFSLRSVAKLEPFTRAACEELVNALADGETCDGAQQYAQHVPVRVMCHLLGVPASDGERFRHWITEALQEGIHDMPRALRALQAINAYFREKVEACPGGTDDLIGYLLAVEPEGRKLDRDDIVAILRLLMIAGIDTTWSAIGSCLWHLATHVDDRRTLAAAFRDGDTRAVDTAIEELLRAYAPVAMAREVVRDTELGGCPMKAGSMVLLSFPAANRDPEVFPDPDVVRLDRAENPHVAFGLGIHRCLGSNLARMELRTALDVWLARIPEFELVPGEPVTWSEGTVRGPRRLPLRLLGGG
ncbi:MAG: cytochrome P450 [Alphaproteobacteria bacterium]|nr:cytochrome P450 [Alphaproteobacteria bacterium]MCB9696236.1 cytochrome P450 [Alphaproteobacteria bacterium]